MGSSILIGKSIAIILETASSFNFEWITYKVGQIWNLGGKVFPQDPAHTIIRVSKFL